MKTFKIGDLITSNIIKNKKCPTWYGRVISRKTYAEHCRENGFKNYDDVSQDKIILFVKRYLLKRNSSNKYCAVNEKISVTVWEDQCCEFFPTPRGHHLTNIFK